MSHRLYRENQLCKLEEERERLCKKNLHAKEPLNRNHGDQNNLETGRLNFADSWLVTLLVSKRENCSQSIYNYYIYASCSFRQQLLTQLLLLGSAGGVSLLVNSVC